MNISDINSSFVSQAAARAGQETSQAEKATKKDYSDATDMEMLEACKQFEAYFIEQVMKEAEKTIPKDESMDSTSSTLVDYFKGNVRQDLAKDIQGESGLGLAQQMYEQMKRTKANVVPVSDVVGAAVQLETEEDTE